MIIHPTTDRTHIVTSMIERDHRTQRGSKSYDSSSPVGSFKMSQDEKDRRMQRGTVGPV
jgi:hypothetical protein